MEKQRKTPVRNRWRPFKRFRRKEDGTVALEFALVALPFFMIIGSIFEFALGYFVNGMLNHGTQEVARLVRTKQVTATSHSPAQFKQLLCDQPVMALFKARGCDALEVDVQQVAVFSNPATPRNPNGSLDTSNMGFSPGGSYSINIMRVYYDFPVVMAWMQGLGNTATPTGRLMSATQAFMIEP